MSEIITKNTFKIEKTKQYDLFATFYGPEEGLSNSIELWDHIPKYFVTEEQQAAMRTPEGFLSTLKRCFKIADVDWAMEIQPAQIQMPDGSEQAFYPGYSEEVIEDALRKLFTQDEYGAYDSDHVKSWVRFSLKQIARELAKWGCSRNIDEIKRSLDIMSGSTVKLFRNAKEVHSTQIITSLTRVDRTEYLENTDSRWACRLPDLLSDAINRGNYRQYNYAISMQLKTQLAKWLHKRFSHNYTQANCSGFYNILLSTVQRDSGLLDSGTMKDKRRKLGRAIDELGDNGVIKSYDHLAIKESRKIVDAKYNLFPSDTFVVEMKAANKRLKDTRQTLEILETQQIT
ncbi:MAG: hypothetical protein JKY88_02560 [Pseudomonadales bacterium]|nr:hypothetical protein [Pseudomonadales bacterium]